MKIAALTGSWMIIGGLCLLGCAEKKSAGTSPAPAPSVTDGSSGSSHAAAPATAPADAPTETPPPPPRPEELARRPEADPGWPMPGQKPVYTGQTPGGVRVEDFVTGEGMPILPGALVTIHFAGRVKDGERFQSTYASGEPETHPMKDFLPGMQEGLVGMKKGGKRRLHIPAALGFAEKGVANDKGDVVILPDSDLVFDIELKDVKLTFTPPAPPAPPALPAPAPTPAQPPIPMKPSMP